MNVQRSKNTVSSGGISSWMKALFSSGQEKNGSLCLYLGPEAPAQVSWAEKKPDRRVRTMSGSLDDFAQFTEMPTTVLVPGSDALITEVELPLGKRGRALQSVPYMIEEDLAEDVEKLHFSFGRQINEGKLRVAVVSRKKMEAWLTLLADAGIEAGAVFPASLFIPLVKGTYSVVAAGNDCLVRGEKGQPFSADPENLDLLLGLAENSDQEGNRSNITFFADGEEKDFPDLLPGREIELVRSSFMETMMDGYQSVSGIDLLQGDYSRSAEWYGLWKHYQLIICSLLLLMSIAFSGFCIDYYRLSSADEKLDAEMRSVFLEAFPDSTRTDNPKMRMESRLKALHVDKSRRDVFFRIYDQVIPVMSQTGGGRLLSLRFKDGRFDFDVEFESLQELDTLKEVLGKNDGVKVAIRNASASGNKVRATLQGTVGKR